MRSALSRSLCHMYHLQASRRLSQPWPQSPRCGDHLKERTGKRERLSNDGSENNPPTWLPAEMKKCNECCYYYRLHQWCIKQLRRAEDITNVTLSDPRLMSSYPRSNRLRDSKIAQREIWCNPEKKKEKQSYQRDERHLWWMREILTSSLCGIPTCSSSWLAR